MSESVKSQKTSGLRIQVMDFVQKTSGLKYVEIEGGSVEIHQSVDGKTFKFNSENISEVLQRADNEGKAFIQVNFLNGYKVLLTDSLVGFKPRETYGLDMTKVPRVVTTPDLVSVFSAIEDGLSSETISEHEIDVLKRVYSAIIQGGEAAGFDLSFERRWLSRLLSTKIKASA